MSERALHRILDEMRTLTDMEAAPTLATVRRWVGLLENAAEDDPIVNDARRQARRDA